MSPATSASAAPLSHAWLLCDDCAAEGVDNSAEYSLREQERADASAPKPANLCAAHYSLLADEARQHYLRLDD